MSMNHPLGGPGIVVYSQYVMFFAFAFAPGSVGDSI